MANLLAVVAPSLLLDVSQGHLRTIRLLVPALSFSKPGLIKATARATLLQSLAVPLVLATVLAFALALGAVHLIEGAAEVVMDNVQHVLLGRCNLRIATRTRCGSFRHAARRNASVFGTPGSGRDSNHSRSRSPML